MDAESVKATIEAPANVGLRNRSRSSIGFSWRISTSTKTARRITEAAIRPRIRALPHPSALPRMSANTRARSAPENRAVPAQSTPVAPGSRVSRRRIWVSTIAASPIGTLMKKIHSQPKPCVIAPPTSGPIATAPPIVAPQTPNAVPRSRPWNSWASSASEQANMAAPPTP